MAQKASEMVVKVDFMDALYFASGRPHEGDTFPCAGIILIR
jgi:hypothetical protein